MEKQVSDKLKALIALMFRIKKLKIKIKKSLKKIWLNEKSYLPLHPATKAAKEKKLLKKTMTVKGRK